MDDTAQFCPACGRSVHALSPSRTAAAVQVLAVHVRILGILWAIYGVFEIVIAFLTVAMSSVYYPMFLKMVAPAGNSPLSPEALHSIFVWSNIFALVSGAMGLFAGWMLLRRERNGRAVALVAAFASLIQLPIGTGLAIYTFVRLMPAAARENYAQLLADQR